MLAYILKTSRPNHDDAQHLQARPTLDNLHSTLPNATMMLKHHETPDAIQIQVPELRLSHVEIEQSGSIECQLGMEL